MISETLLPWRWLVAFLGAIAVHVVILFLLTRYNFNIGAEEPGESGFEVGLGLAQEAILESKSVAAMPEAPAEPIIEETQQPEPEPQVPALPKVVPIPTPIEQTKVVEKAVEKTEPTRVTRNLTQGVANSQIQVEASAGRGDTPTYGGTVGLRDVYVAKLAARINRFKYYPMNALRNRQEGVVHLSLVVGRRGQVLDVNLVQSSGFETLDMAALRIVDRAKPLPRFNRRMTQDQLSVRLPIDYEITKRQPR